MFISNLWQGKKRQTEAGKMGGMAMLYRSGLKEKREGDFDLPLAFGILLLHIVLMTERRGFHGQSR